ncbi:MAG TPA: MerR family transcriptional regulator, partial [Deinococcales bacterium]|nr:MerR family transcriptional regulator [Deinococcales bacterium]
MNTQTPTPLPSDLPAFTASEVEARSGVPAATLRQWERRYGLPVPQRSANGYRLYSLADLECVGFIRDRIAEGVSAARAVELFKMLHDASAEPAAPDRAPTAAADLSGRLLAALLAADDEAADRVFSEAHALFAVEEVLVRIVQPALVAVGELWHDGQITVAHEHRATAYLQGRLMALLDLAGRARSGRPVVVACAPGEHHQIGALMLAIFIRRVG